jgi:protein SCO1/2
VLGSLRALFEGPWFALFMISVLVLWNALILTLMLMPAAPGPLGAFTEDFRRRCLEYDAATGSVVWANALPYITVPSVLAVATVMVYRKQLGAALRRPLALSICVGAALVAVVTGGAGLVAMAGAQAAGANVAAAPFPAHKLRTRLKAPEFTLVNQDGGRVSPQDYQGDVVVLTAVYATCPDYCPMILTQARQAVAALTEEEQASIHVIAVTLDPARDDRAALAGMARGHRIAAPQWNLVTGDRREVDRVLDDMGVWRAWNAEKRRLDHSNVFLLIDRQGRLAYRFSLGEVQQAWLSDALRLLVNEPETRP